MRLNTNNAKKSDIINLLNADSIEIYKSANEIRSSHKGDNIHLRGLIEFSNICKCTCKYCGLRCENKEIKRYRLTEDKIINTAKKASNLGFRTIVLQSGEDSFFTTERLCKIIREIKKFDIAITLSIGERTYEEYKALKEAGADRYLLRIETTDSSLYKELHPNMSQSNRFDCLENLKSLGFETGTGCLVGLPNQTIDSLANDILYFKELNTDMIGIGPFIPHPNTPLANFSSDNFDLALKVMAITRLILPDINIPATTAMETLRQNGRLIALNSGANVVMLNITDNKYKEKYEIYPNKSGCDSIIENEIKDFKAKLKSIGRNISQTKGFRKDK